MIMRTIIRYALGIFLGLLAFEIALRVQGVGGLDEAFWWLW